jgi:hypothetical protein
MTKKKKKAQPKTAEVDNLKRIKKAKAPPTTNRFDDTEFHRMLAKACRENYGLSDPSRRTR